jgi:hypothetical protein
MILSRLVPLSLLVVAACSSSPENVDDSSANATGGPQHPNRAADAMTLYEVQVRVANACLPGVGSAQQRADCDAKVAPQIHYRAEGKTCGIVSDLEKIKLGTLDDMMATDANPSFRKGITLQYIHDRVGANTVWMMPPFPNNDIFNIPDACDNIGSPYAVRDYMHVAGTLSARCIQAGRDEYSDTPCFANDELDAFIQDAHRRGIKVMLDLAFNHFGHNYLMYDYERFTSVREMVARGQNLDGLFDFGGTREDALIHPAILDTPEALDRLAASDAKIKSDLDALKGRCSSLSGAALVRGFAMWRNALQNERDNPARFTCDTLLPEKKFDFLEFSIPEFFMGNGDNPATNILDPANSNVPNPDWKDIKGLYLNEANPLKHFEFVRNREYLFRVMNYWVSRGVDAFRLDHTTDPITKLSPNVWRYVTQKVDFYAGLRGQAQPVYMAEEFGDQFGMAGVVDAMTDGYVGDMCGRNGATKDTSFVERVLGNMDRFNGQVHVMTALETHDERRLIDGTGFNPTTGAGFWGIGASEWSTPMILMGQEYGEPFGLGFRRSDFLRGRFEGTDQFNPNGEALVDFYALMFRARADNEALRATFPDVRAFLRAKGPNGPTIDPRIFAQIRGKKGGSNVVIMFHNLFEQGTVSNSYFIPPDIGDALGIDVNRQYKLVDLVSGQQQGPCHSGADLRNDIFVQLDQGTRMQWLQLQSCQ